MYRVEINYRFAEYEIMDDQESICEDAFVRSVKMFESYNEAEEFLKSYKPVRKPYIELEKCIENGALYIKSYDGTYSILHGRIRYWYTKEYFLKIKNGS